MPEGSNIEIAHHVAEHREQREHAGRSELVLEILEAVLLALVAVATAWSGYQAARWDGQEATLYGRSSKIRVMATEKETRAGQERLYDTSTFNFWLQARLSGNRKLAAAYQKRFRAEYLPAFRAWLATDPFHNSHAPPGPSFLPQYHEAVAADAARLNRHASNVFDRGTKSRETGDKYIRGTVLLATVLFLIAVSQRFRLFKVRVALLVVALTLLAIALSALVTYPRL